MNVDGFTMYAEDTTMSIKVAILGSCISRDAFRFQSSANLYDINANIEHTSIYNVDSAAFPITFEELVFPSNINIPQYNKKMFWYELTKQTKKAFYSESEIPDVIVVDFVIERLVVQYDNNEYDIVKTPRFDQWFSQLDGYFKDKPITIVKTYSMIDVDMQQIVNQYKKFFDEVYTAYPNVKIICIEALQARQTIVKQFKVLPFGAQRNIPITNKRIEKCYAAFRQAVENRNVSFITPPQNILSDFSHIWGFDPLHMTVGYYKYLIECIDNIMKVRFTNTLPNLANQLYMDNTILISALNSGEQIESIKKRIGELEDIVKNCVSKRKLKKYLASKDPKNGVH